MSARPTVRAYIGLGANLGDAAATMAAGVTALDELSGIRVRRVSDLYATAPWGYTDQPEFRNAAVAVDVAGGSSWRGEPTPWTSSRRSRRSSAAVAARHGPDGARASSTSTCCCTAAIASMSIGRQARGRSMRPPTRPKPRNGSRSRTGTSASGCSSWPPSPTSRRGSSRPAGPRRSRRGGASSPLPRPRAPCVSSGSGTAPRGGGCRPNTPRRSRQAVRASASVARTRSS